MASKLSTFFALFFLFSLTKARYDLDTIKRLQGCHKGTGKVQGLHDLKLYLARFGYLNYRHTPNHVNAKDDEFDDELETALKSYQNFYHLNASGTLDGPTVSQMIMPRCGQPDKKSGHIHGTKLLNIVSHYSFFQGRPKWPAGKSHLTYAFGSGYPNPYVPPVDRAFDKWASASGYFTFSRVSDFNRADLKIRFLSSVHGDVEFEDNDLAHAFAPTIGRFHYNAEQKWSAGPGAPVPGANDLETVAIHEIGHLLGLHHSRRPDAIMYPSLSTGEVKGLNEDDILGIKVLYGLNK
ncbi:metalloendoproteinase 5-MMP-like [Bidens hawaiensis]|uniref:metalloendoproteinase 5-MMP-like n=1 Tax=Bidens hawaiensis TaxID=980011 RepID=UPI00404AF472